MTQWVVTQNLAVDMAAAQFDSNTWYSLQNVGNSFYLGCNSISICGADTSDLTNFEFFQIAASGNGSPYYVRPKAREADDDGQAFCINLSTGQPSLALCNADSAIWGTGYWNGANAQDGLFFYNTQLGDNRRLFLSDNGTWSLPDYASESQDDQDLMRWNVISRVPINDQSYSTVPAAITSATAVVTTTTTTTATTPASTTSSPTSVSNSSVVSTSLSSSLRSSLLSSSSPASSTSSTAAHSTTTTGVPTPVVTVTASPTRSVQSSVTPTASPTVVNGAGSIRANPFRACSRDVFSLRNVLLAAYTLAIAIAYLSFPLGQ